MPPLVKRLNSRPILAALAVCVLAACSKPVEKTEEIRPVRAIRVSALNAEVVAEFPGEVRARVESRLGFRVGGKIVERKVDVGSTVKRGQLLMRLDPQDLKLAQAQANAALKAAQSNRDMAAADLKRYKELRSKNFVSQAVLDAKQTAFEAAQASYDQAVAAYQNQSNQAGYAALLSDVDGVVTGVDAEAGQVVAAGTPVVRVAQAGEKEIVIGIPEDKVDTLRKFADVRVRTWAQPDRAIAGKIREVSPVADPATRTYTVKIAIPADAADVRLGMTAYVAFAGKSSDAAIKVPLTALFQDKNASAVWIVDNGVVKPVPVQVSGSSGNDVLLAAGVSPGQIVVTAGVNLLKPGQKVRILGDQTLASASDGQQAAAQASDRTSSDGASKEASNGASK